MARRRRRSRVIAIGASVCALLATAAGFALGAGTVAFVASLPDADSLAERSLPSLSQVLDRHGRVVDQFGPVRRRWLALDELPAHVTQAFVAAEDEDFFAHRGVDPRAIARAAWANLRAGFAVREGASTITQQIVRTLVLSRERTFGRKLREALLALRLEQRLPKERILELYLNAIYLGAGAYGVDEAAHTYFAKSARDLDLAEAALLAGLPQRPSATDPYRYPEGAERRRRYVLRRMREAGFLTASDYAGALALRPALRRSAPRPPEAGFVREAVREILRRELPPEVLERGGLVVETTVDLRLQRDAAAAVEAGLAAYEARHARRLAVAANGGAAAQDVAEGVAPLTPPAGSAEGALLALDARDGAVLALVGSRNFGASPWNRALQARRQPGSTFKPVVYAAALAAGRSPASVLVDRPLVVSDGAGGLWRPRNYDRRFHGRVLLRQALARSINVATAHLAREVGLGRVRAMAATLGIRSPLGGHPSLALGTEETTLLELTRAYGVFARAGRLAPAVLVRRVVDGQGRVILGPRALDVAGPLPPEQEALTPALAYVMTDLLRGAVRDPGATAAAARALPVPVAGKTGTTDRGADAWFVGYTPSVVAGVWVGYDLPHPLGPRETGGRTALPIWMDWVRAGLDHPAEAAPPDFPVPDGVVFAWTRGYRQAFAKGGAPKAAAGPQQAPPSPGALRTARSDLLRGAL